MTRRRISAITVAAIVLCGLLYVYRRPSRPKRVPGDATPVEGAKTIWWQVCKINDDGRGVICQIYNDNGTVLYDEQFVPYDGNPIIDPSELVVARECKYAAPTRICLGNGKILIPRSRFEDEKTLLDRIVRR